MASSTTVPILRFIRELIAAQDTRRDSDADLLRRFIASNEIDAFTALLRRNGPMVYSVCRRLLRSEPDADDVFQATFMVFIRRAGTIRSQQSIASWLHGVAFRLAQRVRSDTARRTLHEQRSMDARDGVATSTDPVTLAAMHDELGRLHDKYRAPLVLCYLQGKSYAQAAEELGWPLGTVCGRLARARTLLRTRLEGRGLSSAVALLATSQSNLPAAVPAALSVATMRVATLVASSKAMLAAGVSARVISLVDGMVKSLVFAKLQMAVTVVAITGTVSIGAGVWAFQQANHSQKPTNESPQILVSQNAKYGPRVDAYGDPLPEGALTRFGSMRFRHAGLGEYTFLDEGRTVLTSGQDRVLRFWDMATGRQIREVELQGTAGPGSCGSLSLDGKWHAAHDNGTIFVWDVATGKEVQTLPGVQNGLGYLYFSPDGKTIAFGSREAVVLWEWETKKDLKIPLPIRKIGLDSTFHACFSSDGKWFVAGGGHNEPLCVFDPATGAEVRRFECNARVSTFSPDSKRLAVACMDTKHQRARGTILRLFDLASGDEIATYPLDDEDGYYSLAFAPDGKTLACGFSDKNLLMDVTTGRILHRLSGKPVWMVFAPDGKTLSGSTSSRLRHWNVASGKEFLASPTSFSPVLAAALSPDGRLLAEAGWTDDEVKVWDIAKARIVRTLPLGSERFQLRNLAFSGDGRMLVTARYQGLLTYWDVRSGQAQRSVQLIDPAIPNLDNLYFTQLCLSPDQHNVSTLQQVWHNGTEVSRLAYWDATDGHLIRAHVHFSERLREGTLLASGSLFALPLSSGLTVVDPKSGLQRFRIADTAANTEVATSPDSRLLAAVRTSAEGDSVGIWEGITGKAVATVSTGKTHHMALTSDNRFLVTTDDEFLRVWDMATGKERQRFPRPITGSRFWGKGFVTRLLVFPDGRRAFTALADGTALIWDLTPAFSSIETLVKNPSADQIKSWWGDLESDDPRRAYAAIWHLAESSERALDFLEKNFQPVPEPDVPMIRDLISKLDDDSFDAREKAFKALEAVGDAAVPSLRQALDGDLSVEVRRRIETLVSKSGTASNSSDQLRRLRAVQVLESIASERAERLLKQIAGGAAFAQETKDAKAVLERLKRRVEVRE